MFVYCRFLRIFSVRFFLFYFPLFCSYWIISIDLSGSLFLSSVISILLLSPSSVFFISSVTYFTCSISTWFSFVFFNAFIETFHFFLSIQEQAQELIDNCRGHFLTHFPLCNLPSILGFSGALLFGSLLGGLGFSHRLSGTLQWACPHTWPSARITEREQKATVVCSNLLAPELHRSKQKVPLPHSLGFCGFLLWPLWFPVWWSLKSHFLALWTKQEGFSWCSFICRERFIFVFYAV